jgi:hypothetical protein
MVQSGSVRLDPQYSEAKFRRGEKLSFVDNSDEFQKKREQ